MSQFQLRSAVIRELVFRRKNLETRSSRWDSCRDQTDVPSWIELMGTEEIVASKEMDKTVLMQCVTNVGRFVSFQPRIRSNLTFLPTFLSPWPHIPLPTVHYHLCELLNHKLTWMLSKEITKKLKFLCAGHDWTLASAINLHIFDQDNTTDFVIEMTVG